MRAGFGADEAALRMRLGRLAEQRGRYREAEFFYRRATLLRPEDAACHLRLGRILLRQGRVPEAESAYAAAVALRPDSYPWLTRLAKLRVRQAKWAEAVECYEALISLKPTSPRLHLALGQVLESGDDPFAAIAVYLRGQAAFGDDPRLVRRLADAYDKVGDWQSAAETLRRIQDPDSEVLLQLARSLVLRYRVPFRCVTSPAAVTRPDQGLHVEAIAAQARPGSGLGVETVATQADPGLFAEAVAALEAAAQEKVGSPRISYRLGRLYERFGQNGEAARAYRQALDELATVKRAWRNTVESDWRFRERYVSEAGDDPRLLRSVTPGDETTQAAPAGYFEALVTGTGLRLHGFLLPDTGDEVELHVDGTRVRKIEVNTRNWRPGFSYEITHSALADFPESASLTMLAGGRHLVAGGGARALVLTNPGGVGRLDGLLAEGRTLSKKGTLALPEAELNDRQLVYVKAYGEMRDLLEDLLGKQLFLLYGTLLGCHRDGAFIAGDDDFDVAYLANSRNPARLKAELRRDALTLLRAGCDIGAAAGGRLFKVRMHGIWLDVNPIWFRDGAAWGFIRHRLTRADFEPVRQTEFLGHQVYVPNDVEAFLVENYGETWRTPQPGFRYYRKPEDVKYMRRSWLRPAELAEFAREAEAVAREFPGAGRFVGIQQPAETGFIND
ncbi:tetratricopeptide repeat protein [Nonomuraea sp. NPDC050536]|uniref:tetratricopeptide repeat protein n=1 Tax=Nonomuraea sp. NPDC050536 TaxID=3364366 RepID=UPI0037C87C31